MTLLGSFWFRYWCHKKFQYGNFYSKPYAVINFGDDIENPMVIAPKTGIYHVNKMMYYINQEDIEIVNVSKIVWYGWCYLQWFREEKLKKLQII